MLIQAKASVFSAVKPSGRLPRKPPKQRRKKSPERESGWDVTILCELSGAEEAGDPERLFGAFQALIVGRQVGLGEGQLQVARTVGQAGVLLALGKENARSVRRCHSHKS